MEKKEARIRVRRIIALLTLWQWISLFQLRFRVKINICASRHSTGEISPLPTIKIRGGETPSLPHKGRTPLAEKPRPKGSKGRKYIPKQLSAFFLRYRRRLVSGLYPTTSLPFSPREMRFSNSVNRRIWFIGHHLLFFLILAFSCSGECSQSFSPLDFSSSWGTSSFPSWFRFWTIVIDIGSWNKWVVVDVGFDWV